MVSQIFWVIKGSTIFYTARLVPSLIISAVIMCVLPFVALLPQPINFWLTVILLVILGAIRGTVAASVFSMGGMLPFEYMSALMIGTAACGLLCNSLRALTLVLFPVMPEDLGTEVEHRNSFYSTLVFFSIAASFMLLCAVVQAKFMATSEFAIYHLDWTHNVDQSDMA
jgi:hypothetical protein